MTLCLSNFHILLLTNWGDTQDVTEFPLLVFTVASGI